MLKLIHNHLSIAGRLPAAFGRLCVETFATDFGAPIEAPAAFGRLCVETINLRESGDAIFPAAFGRLCVETLGFDFAALSDCQPPSGGCVLKLSFHTVHGFKNPSRLRAAVC